ncbi:hypothetical protein HYFRA_00007373 [Hymenoscyphus fraxineus]|uniref:CMP/dCMP-type deaminase domain-containing protein n=1 Tax=Hymenoscyphus fraxineus TaxID=746836 RepID=A0A9N9PRG6_9HELO|nr:hypothetical protein HYFRA_00007373 [Hymenoscyphus fraxineus]
MNSESAASHRVPALALAPPTDGGQLIPLKTTLETRAAVRVLNVYFTKVPVRKASGALGVVRALVPRDGGFDFQHLRRFAKPSVLPEGVRRREGGEGNVAAHAVMRGIGMVSQGLARDYTASSTIPPFSDTEGGIFRNHPLLDLERDLPEKEVDVGGYLCHDLEIYCTHEPCVMCSMAIVHSRFGRAVFEKRMCGTGGLCADEGGLGHGLWWRKELNWTMLGWRWVRPVGFREGRGDVVDEGLSA